MSLLSERERGAGCVLMWMLLVRGFRVILFFTYWDWGWWCGGDGFMVLNGWMLR